MRYSITFTQEVYSALVDHLFQLGQTERAAYLLCGLSHTEAETRLLVRCLLPVLIQDVLTSSRSHMEIEPQSFMRAMKEADMNGVAFVFVHSHPPGVRDHSPADDKTEASLFRTAYIRIGTHSAVHASIVFSAPDCPSARVWHRDGSYSPVTMIRVIGDRFRFYGNLQAAGVGAQIFDRQIRAFGSAIQQMLGSLHIGIVGAGGTGSAVAEQLIRLGVGRLSEFDSQCLEASNTTRVYGSGLKDAGQPKVEIIRRHSDHIGLGTNVTAVDSDITQRASAELLRDCDVIFGCTDDELGRSILCRMATDYYIPVFDMGVKINSKDGEIVSVEGRVTTLVPGTACLFCRGRITAEGVSANVIAKHSKAQIDELRRQGYAPELHENAPAVIPFTTAVASAAVQELLHRLTGFMGSDRTSSEAILFFDQSRIRTNRVPPQAGCFCADHVNWGIGDQTPFLGILWQD
jgi:molybdopterin/thiamine biosynthesis adenylyltransferase